MNISKFLGAILAAVSFSGAALAADPAVPADYPLKKCVVSGEEIGSGGMVPYKVAHDGTDVWLCCKGCKKSFDKQPAKFAQAVKDAAPKK